MALIDDKIVAFSSLIASLPIRPNADGGLTADELQEYWDESSEELRMALNSVIDRLISAAGAGDLGAVAVTGGTAVTVQAILDELKAFIDTKAVGADTFTKTEVNNALALKANDNAVMHLTGNETVAGVKAFSSSPTVPTPTTPSQATPKSYIDQVAANFMLGAVPNLSIVKAKLEQSVQDTLTSIDTPEQATITLDETAQVTKVTDSYSGIADLMLKGDTLFQALVNGNFANGTTGWDVVAATLSAANKILSVTGNGSGGGVIATNDVNVVLRAGDKYFIKFKVRVTNASCISMSLRFDGVTAGTETLLDSVAPTQNVWYDLYGVAVISDQTGKLEVYIRHTYADAATANGKVMEVDGNTGVFAIPITGTPYEAMTADEINNKIGAYFEGLKGATLETVGSRGKNLFDVRALQQGALGVDGQLLNATSARVSLVHVPLKDLAHHVKTYSSFMKIRSAIFVDRNKKVISEIVAGAYDELALSPPNGTAYISISFTRPDFSTPISPAECKSELVQLEEGTVATAYVPFDGSQVSISAVRHKLPNLIEDSLEFVDGRWLYYKRTAEYVLLSSDVDQLTTTNVNNDLVRIVRTNLPSIFAQESGVTPNKHIIPNFKPSPNAILQDTIGEVGNYIDSSGYSSRILLVVAKGTYANLAAAQTALAGTKIVYQLAQPLEIEEKDFSAYNITIDGSLSSNHGSTEFYVSGYDILTDTLVTYPLNTAAAVESLKESVDGIKEKMGNWLTDDPWIYPTLLNGWVAFGGTYSTARYYKDDFGIVHLSGVLKTGTVPSTAFNLPEGFRPLYDLLFASTSNSLFARVDVKPNGNVGLNVGSNLSFNLDGISFRAGA